MKTDKEIIATLKETIIKLNTRNLRLAKKVRELKKYSKLDENKQLRESLNNVTALYGKLLRKQKKENYSK